MQSRDEPEWVTANAADVKSYPQSWNQHTSVRLPICFPPSDIARCDIAGEGAGFGATVASTGAIPSRVDDHGPHGAQSLGSMGASSAACQVLTKTFRFMPARSSELRSDDHRSDPQAELRARLTKVCVPPPR
jgi:hypothetical protein